MIKYTTQYKIGRSQYGSHIFAKSLKQANCIAKERNIGEKILGKERLISDGYGRKVPEELYNPTFADLNEYSFVSELPKIIHSACFLSFIGVASGKMSNEQTYGDEGIVHQLIHLLNSSDLNTRNIRRTKGNFMNLQNQIPGHLKYPL